MSNGTSGGSSLTLDSYSLETTLPEGGDVSAAATSLEQTPLRITLRGRWFKIGAIDPKIMIGNVELKDYETMSDESTIIGFLHEIPPEDSVISVDYGRGIRAELPERFSLSKLSENQPSG